MPRGRCCHRHMHDQAQVCSCEMGNLYRFAEPIVLLALSRLGEAHGYQIAQEAEGLAVTHAGLDSAVVYRTLRRLEEAGRVSSAWDTSGPGPARRIYRVTESGREHLAEWAAVLEQLASTLQSLVRGCREAVGQPYRRTGSTVVTPA